MNVIKLYFRHKIFLYLRKNLRNLELIYYLNIKVKLLCELDFTKMFSFSFYLIFNQKMSERNYTSLLTPRETEEGIKLVKDTFEHCLARQLNLFRVSAPRFLKTGTGLQDDLAGTQKAVAFQVAGNINVEIVHSLAKWKRYTLGKYECVPGEGIYTDMDAVRRGETLDDIHSAYVDQWDWERVVRKEDRTLNFLKEIVEKIYAAIKETAKVMEEHSPVLVDSLPDTITFIHSETLAQLYLNLSPEEREYEAAKEFGAIFLVGIGHNLNGSGKPHDVRAADYDDWSTLADGKRGLNGDIIVWDSVRQKHLELSSMGIRVDAEALKYQLKVSGLEEYAQFPFHKAVLEDTLPLSIGGGIGQSRLCMLLLQKAHIGEVQSSVWTPQVEKECKEKKIRLL